MACNKAMRCNRKTAQYNKARNNAVQLYNNNNIIIMFISGGYHFLLTLRAIPNFETVLQEMFIIIIFL